MAKGVELLKDGYNDASSSLSLFVSLFLSLSLRLFPNMSLFYLL